MQQIVEFVRRDQKAVAWICLSHRLDTAKISELVGRTRVKEAMRVDTTPEETFKACLSVFIELREETPGWSG